MNTICYFFDSLPKSIYKHPDEYWCYSENSGRVVKLEKTRTSHLNGLHIEKSTPEEVLSRDHIKEIEFQIGDTANDVKQKNDFLG